MTENERGIAKISIAVDTYLRGNNYFLGIAIDAYQRPPVIESKT